MLMIDFIPFNVQAQCVNVVKCFIFELIVPRRGKTEQPVNDSLVSCQIKARDDFIIRV